MALKSPVSKRNKTIPHHPSLPILQDETTYTLINENLKVTYSGYFNGSAVIIDDPDEVTTLYKMGFFGKGSLSRSFPCFGKRKKSFPPIIKERQWKRRKEWANQLESILEQLPKSFHNEMCDSSPQQTDNVSVAIEDDKINDLADDSKESSFMDVEKEQGRPTGSQEKLSFSNPKKNLEREMEVGSSTTIKLQIETIQDDSNDVEIVETIENCEENCNDDASSSKTNSNTTLTIGSDEKETTEITFTKTNEEFMVLADSDEEVDDFLNNLNPHIEEEHIKVVIELLHLTLEEAFFLSFALGCLNVVDLSGKKLSLTEMWKLYKHSQNDFIESYTAYHYFRSKGWVVKSGLKFGGQFLLYKEGPPFYHASYIVIIDNINKLGNTTNQYNTWEEMLQLHRMGETSKKEILVCHIQWPDDMTKMECPTILKTFKVSESLLRRWLPAQGKED